MLQARMTQITSGMHFHKNCSKQVNAHLSRIQCKHDWEGVSLTSFIGDSAEPSPLMLGPIPHRLDLWQSRYHHCPQQDHNLVTNILVVYFWTQQYSFEGAWLEKLSVLSRSALMQREANQGQVDAPSAPPCRLYCNIRTSERSVQTFVCKSQLLMCVITFSIRQVLRLLLEYVSGFLFCSTHWLWSVQSRPDWP